ncbi:unnamed protein product [Prorocentrum cordatum]|uniref:Uncharacterized protein n=1 Tax=Prorocentrum cordatum TaxID=2364126 RepID=A0ABN9QFP8_9DINO|nr:unnamed protein product [Polarella glacialis]
MCAWPSPGCPPPAVVPAWDMVGMQRGRSRRKRTTRTLDASHAGTREIEARRSSASSARRNAARRSENHRRLLECGPRIHRICRGGPVTDEAGVARGRRGGEDHVPGRTAGSAGTTTPGWNSAQTRALRKTAPSSWFLPSRPPMTSPSSSSRPTRGTPRIPPSRRPPPPFSARQKTRRQPRPRPRLPSPSRAPGCSARPTSRALKDIGFRTTKQKNKLADAQLYLHDVQDNMDKLLSQREATLIAQRQALTQATAESGIEVVAPASEPASFNTRFDYDASLFGDLEECDTLAEERTNILQWQEELDGLQAEHLEDPQAKLKHIQEIHEKAKKAMAAPQQSVKLDQPTALKQRPQENQQQVSPPPPAP